MGAALVALAAGPAGASPFELYGASGRAAAMGGAQTAVAEGPAAIFYNLGALARSRTGVTVGFTGGFDRARILLDERPAGYDVSDLGGHAKVAPTGGEPYARRDTTDLDQGVALNLGAVTSFGLDNFRAGLLLSMPMAGYVNADTRFADERERMFSNQLDFTLVDERIQRMVLELGAGYRVAPWLSVGLGATFVPGTTMSNSVYIPDVGDQADVDINADIGTASNIGLLAGVLVDLGDSFKLGAQYRGESYFRIHGENRIRLGAGGGQDESLIVQQLDWTPSYSPDTLAVGLAWQAGRALVTADARYERWSDFHDAQSQPAGFADTVSPRLGVELELASGNHVRAGLGWVPSPVPDQTGRTNYVDNDRLIASVGASYRFEALSQPLQLDWSLQFHTLLRRETKKAVLASYPVCGDGVTEVCDEVPDHLVDPRTGQPFPEAQGLQTGNPGFPGFTSGGWLGAIVVELSWLP